ncbi:MAG TPA: hypothetical protein VL547_16910 [Dinghuibacter sp.]|uniref:hypothetical protein n=1 Tax=Dinghuibacter sp. TaxID=2024697 RepID=UPI002C033A4B|nr:hypothetical protein [Dinghuibacter sp.]HTJ13721.1 hypothetical protein [Dinghuibacter sp.]
MQKILLIAALLFASAKAQTPHKPKPVKKPDAFWLPDYQSALHKAAQNRGIVLVKIGLVDATLRTLTDSLQKDCAAGVAIPATDSVAKSLSGATFAYVMEDGTPIYRFEGAPGRKDYIAGLHAAEDRADAMRNLRILQAERLLGDKDENKLEAIIAERNVEGLPADSLLDLYVEALPQDSLGSPRVLRFIALQAPVLNSAANQLLRQDALLFNDVWASLTLQERVKINNDVINKTKDKAVTDADQEEAQLAATFAANTNANATAKVRAFQGVMLDFYYGVGDTLKFLDLAKTYYDRFLMPFDADSLRHQDSIRGRAGELSVAHFVGTQLETGAKRVTAMAIDADLKRKAAAWADRAAALLGRGTAETRTAGKP